MLSQIVSQFQKLIWVISIKIVSRIVAFGAVIIYSISAQAVVLSPELEAIEISGVDNTFDTISFDNTYTSPVVVCTYHLPSTTDVPAVIRTQNIGTTSFEIKAQNPDATDPDAAVTPSTAYCLIAETGTHSLGGVNFEVGTVISDQTNVRPSFTPGLTETITPVTTFSSPVVLGQVQTYNDPDWSAFWSNNCTDRAEPPPAGNGNICIGKHVGQDGDITRADETLGYIIVEDTTGGTIPSSSVTFDVELGADGISGPTNGAGTYGTSADFNFASATQSAMDGGDGSWAVLFGADPLAGSNIDLAVDEDQIGDVERNHTEEQVAFWGFALPDAQDDFAVADLDLDSHLPVEIDVLTNDNVTAVDDTLCIVDPADNICKTSLSITGQGAWTVLLNGGAADTLQFDPDQGFSGRIDTVKYRVDEGGGVIVSANAHLALNERALCEANDDMGNPLNPFIIGVYRQEFYVFEIGDAANLSVGGGITGVSSLILDMDTVTRAPSAGTGPITEMSNIVNSVGLDSHRDVIFFASNDGFLDTLFMYDGDSQTVYELVGESNQGLDPGNADGDNNPDTVNLINYTDVNELAASFGIPAPITAGGRLGGAAGEYWGGSYYFGIEDENGGLGDIDQLWRLDLDFNNPLNGPVPTITNMQLVHTFENIVHDWGDIIIFPDTATGTVTLIDVDRGNNRITTMDVTNPGDGTSRNTPIATNVNTRASPASGNFSQAATTFDNTLYIFIEDVANSDQIQAFDLATNMFLGTNGPTEINGVEEGNGGVWPEGAATTDGSSCVNPFSSLPVSLGQFESKQVGNRIKFNWSTSTETFIAGFNLWGESEGNWYQLNKQLVATGSIDSMTPRSYSYNANIRDLPGEVTEVALTSVDLNGHEEGFGPFALDESYGSEEAMEPIPWGDIRSDHDARMADEGYVEVEGRWRRSTDRLTAQLAAVAAAQEVKGHIGVSESGMYRLTHEALMGSGIDLTGVLKRDIAITYKGQPVTRHMGQAKRFGPGHYIDFYGESPIDIDGRYIRENLYQVEVNRSQVSQVRRRRIRRTPGASPQSYEAYIGVDDQNAYGFTLPTEDPWFNEQLLLGGSLGKDFGPYEIELPLDIDPGVGGILKLVLGTSSDPEDQDLDGDGEVDPNHEISVTINGQGVILDPDSDDPMTVSTLGRKQWEVEAELSAGQIQAGTNSIVIRLTGDTGYPFDIQVLDTYGITYTRPLTAEGDQIEIINSGEGEQGTIGGYSIDGYTNKTIVGYAYAKSVDDPYRPANVARLEVKRKKQGETYTASIPTVSDGGAGYWVSTSDSLLSASNLYAAQPNPDLLSQQGNYLIITHPAFMPSDGETGHPLQNYVSAKQAEGDATYDEPVLINLYDIYEQYGYGMKLPQAITDYLKAANEVFDYNYVLYVGGDVYDYLDYLETGSISFIPTKYAHTNTFIHQTPSDALMTDLDGDEISDKAHGRWPVRTIDDLSLIVQKTLDFGSADGLSTDRSALLIGEQVDPAGFNFKDQVERINDEMNNPDPWEDTPDKVTRIYLDDMNLTDARAAVQTSMVGGNTVTVFSGHGSPDRWMFSNLLNQSYLVDIPEGQNTSSLVMPLACYTTYYNEVHVNTLAHQLMFSGDRGAVAIHGAITLSNFKDNESLGKRAMSEQVENGQTLGNAINTARHATPSRDVRINWMVLGDPTVRVN